MDEILNWYAALGAPFKIAFWVLIVFVGLALIKRLTKVAILVTILIILIFVARAVIVNLP